MNINESLTWLDFTVVGIYIIALLGLGFWVSFKRKGAEDLFLAGRSLIWPNIGLSIFGTNVSPSFMIGACGVAYATGMVAGNFEWLAWFFLMLLAMVFVPHYLNTKISTMPEFMQRRYGKGCRDFLSWYTVLSTLIVWLGGTLYAGGLLLGQTMGWPLWLSVVFLTIIATSFTVTGGLAAVVITDSFQSILMILASIALTVIGLFKVGSLDRLLESVPGDYWLLFRPVKDPDYPMDAILLGYPVLAIWFWCTDQTIVQRVLGGRDIRQGQLGAVFCGYLKILTPLIFFLPGILCKVLYPNLESPDHAYMTMVAECMPKGLTGLIIAVLIAALISTIDSGLNSLSTIFTLDIYQGQFKTGTGTTNAKRVGQITTVFGAGLAILIAIGLNSVERDLFSLLQSLIAYLAPPMAVVFLVGVLWKRANHKAAFLTLVLGSILSLGIGICDLADYPSSTFWPHFMRLAFLIFAGLLLFMVVITLLTSPPPPEKQLPSLRETYKQSRQLGKPPWVLWATLAVIMIIIYVAFQYAGTHF